MKQHSLKLSIVLLLFCNIWVACLKDTETASQTSASGGVPEVSERALCNGTLIIGVTSQGQTLQNLQICGILNAFPFGQNCTACGKTFGRFVIDSPLVDYTTTVLNPTNGVYRFSLTNTGATPMKLKLESGDPCFTGLPVTINPSQTLSFRLQTVGGCCSVLAGC